MSSITNPKNQIAYYIETISSPLRCPIMDFQISVLTLVKGRKTALINLLNGLKGNPNIHMELIIVHMNEEVATLPFAGFPVRSFSCYSDEKLPLAKARNFAVAKATSEFCIFLDVDCIPAPDFISLYLEALKKEDKLWSGAIRYLQEGFPLNGDSALLDRWSTPDSIRSNLQTLPYELFWSLNFGCSKSLFIRTGGFDESFTGYGAEDTDFAFTARLQDIELGLVPAMAYHQPHASYDPPLNHLQDIVRNATVFYYKWQQWPMEGWLSKFAELGYVSWNSDSLTLTSLPSPDEIERYRK